MKSEEIMEQLIARDPGQKEFHQAAREVIESVEPVVNSEPRYSKFKIISRIVEPERQIMFRVPWEDESGDVHVNRGYRVEFNSAIGPYKGGLRFHPSVNLGIIKFLGFEQIFKNSLTGLPMGGGKGGSDFDPHGKTDMEVMHFCQSFMCELYRHIGPNTDVPAGDIGVGAREIGFLYGMYKKITNKFESVLTGKDPYWGGSKVRPEATGYGAVYFCQHMAKTKGVDLKGKTVAISGSGNVAQYAMEKCLQIGAKPVTLSDSSGYVYAPDGFNKEMFDYMMELKNIRRGRISEMTEKFKDVTYHKGKRPWEVKCDVALPCATQNEIEKDDAKKLIDGGCKFVAEGANMPSNPDAIELFLGNDVYFGPAKAVNAGGVAVSGLEMAQNHIGISWSFEEVDQRLAAIMKDIYDNSTAMAKKYSTPDNLIAGANIAGFVKVANSMCNHGLI